MESNFDYDKMQEAIEVLKPNNELFECRILMKTIDNNCKVWEKTLSGYFCGFEKLKEAISAYENTPYTNFFITLNEINPACYSRLQRDRFLVVTPTTSDSDIIRYEWLLIDLDPVRPAGVSSTAEDCIKAKEKADEIAARLVDLGFTEPIMAFSGNGIHVLFKINIENIMDGKSKDAGTAGLIQNVLQAIAILFSDDAVKVRLDSENQNDAIKVDEAVFNPARIFKLYGTKAQKGSNTQERPHRMSGIIKRPEVIEPTEVEALLNVIAAAKQRERR